VATAVTGSLVRVVPWRRRSERVGCHAFLALAMRHSCPTPTCHRPFAIFPKTESSSRKTVVPCVYLNFVMPSIV